MCCSVHAVEQATLAITTTIATGPLTLNWDTLNWDIKTYALANTTAVATGSMTLNWEIQTCVFTSVIAADTGPLPLNLRENLRHYNMCICKCDTRTYWPWYLK